MNPLLPLGAAALLLASLVPAAAATTGTVDADVKPYCRIGEPECAGYLVCVYETTYTTEVCVRDPCDDTQCTFAASSAWPKCVVIVPEGGDMGEKVCVDPKAECKAWYQRTTFIGTWTVCLVPPGSDGGPDPDAVS